MMKRFLLTGATGFVGRQILSELERRGKQTVIVVRPGWDTRITIKSELTQVIETEDLFAEGSEWWCKRLSGIDTVIHAAWIAKPNSYLTSVNNLDCLAGTLAMAKAAVGTELRRFVGIGTCIEYAPSIHPLSVDSPLDAGTPYAAAKLSAFVTLRELFKEYGVSFLWCRLFHPYGIGEDPNRLIPFLHEQLKSGLPVELSAGEQVRDFIEVADAAKHIVDGVMSNAIGPANICNGRGKSVRDLAFEIASLYDRPDLLKFGARPERKNEPKSIVGIPTRFDAS